MSIARGVTVLVVSEVVVKIGETANDIQNLICKVHFGMHFGMRNQAAMYMVNVRGLRSCFEHHDIWDVNSFLVVASQVERVVRKACGVLACFCAE